MNISTAPWLMLGLLVLSATSLKAQSQPAAPTQESTDNWLHPNDTAYNVAIGDGFNGTAKTGNYAASPEQGIHQVWFNFNGKLLNNVMIMSPLRCSQFIGIYAKQNLLDRPTATDVRQFCDGILMVEVTYTTRREATSFPIIIRHGETIVRAPDNSFHSTPSVHVESSQYYVEYVYTYDQVFTFRIPEPWTDAVIVRFVVPDEGNPREQTVDLTVFSTDELAYSKR